MRIYIIIPSIVLGKSYLNSDIPQTFDINLYFFKLPEITGMLKSSSLNLISNILSIKNNLIVPGFGNGSFKNYLCNLNGLTNLEGVNLLNFSHNWYFIPKFENQINLLYPYINSYFFHLSFLCLIYLLYPYVSKISNIIISLLILVKPAGGELYFYGLSLTHFYKYSSSLLLLYYLGSGIWFDWLIFRIYVRHNLTLNLQRYIIAGILYSSSIIAGIIFTNSLWYIMDINNLTAFLFGSPLSMLFSGVWYLLRRSPNISRYGIINSIFHQVIETISFIAICVSTYGSWNLYLAAIPNTVTAYYIAVTLGLFFHLLSGYYIIGLELRSGNFLYYGVLYWIWWSSAIFNTNSLVGFFIDNLLYSEHVYSWVFTIIVTFFSVVINYPNYYLDSLVNISTFNDIIELGANNSTTENVNSEENTRGRIVNFFITNRYALIIRLYICILSYCFSGGLLWSLILSYFI